MNDRDPNDLMRLLVAHTDAWNERDLEALMELFADDCVFEAAGGDEACGTTYAGKPAVRAAFADIYASLPDAHFGGGRHSVIDREYGVSEWVLTGTLGNGARIEIAGCDFLTVRDGTIVRKNSYTKDRPPIT